MYNHASAIARLPLVLSSVKGAVHDGCRPIVSYFMGANGIPTLQEITAYSKAVRGAGAQFILCTILPKGADKDWETNRLAYNTMVKNRKDLYDALADFGASPTIGAFGAPSARKYYGDNVHLNEAGDDRFCQLLARRHDGAINIRFDCNLFARCQAGLLRLVESKDPPAMPTGKRNAAPAKP